MLQNKSSYEIIPNKLFEGIKELQLNLDMIQNNFLSFNKGEIIYQKGDPANLLYLIVEGKIKLEIVKADESFSIVIKPKGDFWGTNEDTGMDHIISATAFENSIICKIDVNQLNSLTEIHPEIERNIQKYFFISKNNDPGKTEKETKMINREDTVESSDIINTGEFDQPEKIKFEDIHKLYENIPEEISNSEEDKTNSEENSLPNEIKENPDVFENSPNKDYEYVRLQHANDKTSAEENIISMNSLLTFLSEDINYSIKLIDNLLTYIKENYAGTDLLINTVKSENKNIKNYIDTAAEYFNNDNALLLETVSFNQTMEDVLSRLAEYAESKKINIFRKYAEDSLVEIDRDKFYIACLQIIKKLCENISDARKILITVNKDESNILIEFKDDAFEIPPDSTNNIPKPLASIDNNKMGLGLVSANKIINDHNGKILMTKSDELELFLIKFPIFEEN
jgi:Cyclic nucleotide-binding domain